MGKCERINEHPAAWLSISGLLLCGIGFGVRRFVFHKVVTGRQLAISTACIAATAVVGESISKMKGCCTIDTLRPTQGGAHRDRAAEKSSRTVLAGNPLASEIERLSRDSLPQELMGYIRYASEEQLESLLNGCTRATGEVDQTRLLVIMDVLHSAHTAIATEQHALPRVVNEAKFKKGCEFAATHLPINDLIKHLSSDARIWVVNSLIRDPDRLCELLQTLSSSFDFWKIIERKPLAAMREFIEAGHEAIAKDPAKKCAIISQLVHLASKSKEEEESLQLLASTCLSYRENFTEVLAIGQRVTPLLYCRHALSLEIDQSEEVKALDKQLMGAIKERFAQPVQDVDLEMDQARLPFLLGTIEECGTAPCQQRLAAMALRYHSRQIPAARESVLNTLFGSPLLDLPKTRELLAMIADMPSTYTNPTWRDKFEPSVQGLTDERMRGLIANIKAKLLID